MGLIAIVTMMPAPVGALRHDRDCIANGFGGADAGSWWPIASVLIDFDCTGEVRASASDNHDWFKISAPVLGGGDRTLRACPLSAGLNTDLDVFRQPALPTAPVGAPDLPQLAMLPAGFPVGSSAAGAGCDAVTLPAADNAGGNTIYIHVTRTAGDGLYNLRVL